ncbi:MAG: mechanosensitive ion channel family protein [Crocinitomicaceae bacterium]
MRDQIDYILFDKATEIAVTYAPKLIGAIIIWIIGGWVIKGLINTFTRMLDKSNADESLKPFLKSIINAALRVMLIISVLTMLGVEMTSFIALLGAAGLAVGMALSGTLQNFAGGVIILVIKPFKIGDVIEAQGYIGTVKEIQIFNTTLKTADNKTIIIPNGGLATSSLINYTTEENRRVEWTFSIGYGDDTSKAKEILKALCDADERILKDPETFIAISALADNSVNFIVRSWVKANDLWNVYFEMNEKVYNAFNKEGLNIPFPQMDIHLHKVEQNK